MAFRAQVCRAYEASKAAMDCGKSKEAATIMYKAAFHLRHYQKSGTWEEDMTAEIDTLLNGMIG